jgi:hypothetical protein
MYHNSNTKHVRVPVGTANINAYFQDTDLPGCLPGWQANLRNNNAVEISDFAVATFLI